MSSRRKLAVAVLILAATGALLYLRYGDLQEIHPAHDSAALQAGDLIAGPNDWPWWRGTTRTNVVSMSAPPLEWSPSSNLLWKTEIPGKGHSTPIVWGNRVFLTTAELATETVLLLCLDRDSGHILWQKELHRGGFIATHAKNSHASPTPACDGQHVFVVTAIRDAIWVSAVDLDGQLGWQKEIGPYGAIDGYGPSPALYKGLVIVAADNSGRGITTLAGTSFLTALDRMTGQIVWRTKRLQADSNCSPVVANIAGQDQLVLPCKRAIIAYDPANGAELWTCRWGAERPACTVAFDDLHIYATAKYPTAETVCIQADGRGDVTDTKVEWRITAAAGDVPSPVVHEGSLYSVSDNGVLTCVDTATGRMLWKRRLGGNVSASPLIAGDYLYCCSEEGMTSVLKWKDQGQVAAQNDLEDGIYASPVLPGDRLILRSLHGLFCVKAAIPSVIAETPDKSNAHK